MPRSLPGIPPEAQPLFDAHYDAPLVSAEVLREELAAYARHIAERTSADDVIDASVGEALARSCQALIDLTETDDRLGTRRLVQAAVRYFIDEDDVEPDRDSLFGLDDDAAVCNAVARHLGREDLVVEVS